MSDEPRRSGRATKGQHNKASSSPAPSSQAKPTAKATKSKTKKSKSEPQEESGGEGEGEDDAIRCICGNDNPTDKRAFIGCEACLVWQHNVCMGEPEDEDDVPEHYFCEECRPEEHRETLQALAEGRKIWEERTTRWKQWKKMSSSRRKSKGKGEEAARPSWLKREAASESTPVGEAEPVGEESGPPETGTKRKRDSVKPEPGPEPELQAAQPEVEEKPTPQARPDKRRKSSQAVGKDALDHNTAVVDIDQLPADRKKIAVVLSNIISDDIRARAEAGFRIPGRYTADSLGHRLGGLIEYSLLMNYNEPTSEKYKSQFRALNANLKKNKLLIERLLDGSLMADDLATMESKDMASEELQLERAKMKEELDRQVVAVEADDGRRIRRTHKGDEIIEDETYRATEFASNSAPVRERTSMAEDDAGRPPAGAGSPTQAEQTSQATDTKKAPTSTGPERRTSSQQFDMSNIWAKTAQSPTTTNSVQTPRPMQMPPRRRSSVQPVSDQQDGAKDDPDVDRMLRNDDDEEEETYSPAEYTGDDSIVWRGKLVHSGEGEPMVNARFVAGRDLTPTVAWRTLLPEKLGIDGRLATSRAEEYLCGLEWSHSSDVSVLALTAYDDAEAFKAVFEYFKSRGRYAVVNKDKPKMIKDLYIIPVEVGGGLPEHVEKLEFCGVKLPVEERLLLATLVVSRAPGVPQIAGGTESASLTTGASGGQNGGPPQHLPQHVRASTQGPAGSPINPHNHGPYSPGQQNAPPTAGYGAPPGPQPFPPSLYQAQPHDPAYPASGAPMMGAPAPDNSVVVAEVLGPLQYEPTAQRILQAEPGIGREKLENLRKIMDEHPETRRDIDALARKLMG